MFFNIEYTNINIYNKIGFFNHACKSYKSSLGLTNLEKIWFRSTRGLKYDCKHWKKDFMWFL